MSLLTGSEHNWMVGTLPTGNRSKMEPVIGSQTYCLVSFYVIINIFSVRILTAIMQLSFIMLNTFGLRHLSNK